MYEYKHVLKEYRLEELKSHSRYTYAGMGLLQSSVNRKLQGSPVLQFLYPSLLPVTYVQVMLFSSELYLKIFVMYFMKFHLCSHSINLNVRTDL
jgi:hypothetical protein